MVELDLSADELITALLHLAQSETVCILDSCSARYPGSHLLIAGLEPVETLEISNDDPARSLQILDEKLLTSDLAAIFALSYDLGLKLEGIKPRAKEFQTLDEPDIFIALFDSLAVHNYDSGRSMLVGNVMRFSDLEGKLRLAAQHRTEISSSPPALISGNFTKEEYIDAIETIKEHICRGDTYQVNLTQQFRATLPDSLTPQEIFRQLRRDNPAPFAAFIKRAGSAVVSASPERFIRVSSRNITASPIKGTRPRGGTPAEDAALKNALLASEKDRAENTMIVDLLRNDFGRVCEFGSVKVEKLCELQEFPTLFHLVSTINGKLRKNTSYSEIIKAVFPCGSITGAPKIRTMQIIDEIESANRGLSMGAIGYFAPGAKFGTSGPVFDLSVAIRTMVIRGNEAVFNVGGGIVIDSDPNEEYDEVLVKAKALLSAIGADAYDKM